MPANKLSRSEKLALQSGAVLQVSIVEQDDKGYTVDISGRKKHNSIDDFPNAMLQKYESTQKPVAAKPKAPPKGGLILNGLKTGFKLEGKVVSSTMHNVFVMANVFRIGKGGRFAPVTAIMHKSDISTEILEKAQRGKKDPKSMELMTKNTPITVYVKEVFKNSG